jgi:hypothetical protein
MLTTQLEISEPVGSLGKVYPPVISHMAMENPFS